MDQHLQRKTTHPGDEYQAKITAMNMRSETVIPSNFSELFLRRMECEAIRAQFKSDKNLFLCSEPLECLDFRKLWIIDGDDTLWEDNIYYEQLAGDLAEYLFKMLTIEQRSFRELLDQVEHEIIPIHGFGPLGFKLSVVEAFRRATQGHPQIDEPRELFDRVIPLLTGVPYGVDSEVTATLRALRLRGDGLVLFTQGPNEVQQGKIAQSNLAPLFHGLAVGADKKDETYQTLLSRLPFRGQEVIVVGNSINSEVLPALRLGLRAVHYENPNSWHAVNSASAPDNSYTKVRSFRSLLEL